MQQRKSVRQGGALVALLAVWIQLVLGFGHMHADELFGRAGLPAMPGHGLASVSAAHHLSPLGTPQDQSGAAEHACAVCAGMALLAAGHLPDPALLPVPAAGVAAIHAATAAFLIARTRFVGSRPRAPPAFEMV
jgi:hypothetical protein